MKKLIPILGFLFLQPALAQDCDQRKVLRLMAEKKIIDLKDKRLCLSMDNFPSSMRIKMKDQKHGLDLNQTADSNGAYAAVKKIEGVLNSPKVLNGSEKFVVITKGVADGTYNLPAAKGKANYEEDIAEEMSFLKTISDEKGIISLDLVESVIGPMDKTGALAIKDALKKYYDRKGKVPFDKIDENEKGHEKENHRLKSMVRNSSRAKARAKKMCSEIFGSPDACQSEGEISSQLETGERNFVGCCDGRRGAIIDIQSPVALITSKKQTGSFEPKFDKPSQILQSKMNFAAALSIFKYPLEQNDALENDILINENFDDDNLEADRKRFAKMFEGTSCESNDFAIDAVRRIYWQVKLQKSKASSDLYDAIVKGDYKKVIKAFENRSSLTNKGDKALLTVLATGGNNLAATNKAATNDCYSSAITPGSLISRYNYDNLPDKTVCKLLPSPELAKKLSDLNAGKKRPKPYESLNDLMNSDWVNDTKNDKRQVYVIKDGRSVGRGHYYLYDVTTKQSYAFSFPRECPASGLSPKSKIKWNSDEAERLPDSCLQAASNQKFTIPNSFYANATQSSGVPTDAFNCLDSSQGVEDDLANPDSKTASQAGEPYCNLKPSTLKLDINSINPPHHCGACKSGPHFDPKTGSFSYKARHGTSSQNPSSELRLQNPSAIATMTGKEGKIKDNPLSMGSMKHYRSYIIKDCGTSCADACACLRSPGLNERLKVAERIDFSSPMIPGAKKSAAVAYNGSKEDETGSYACIFSPPISDTCSFNPMGGAKTEGNADGDEGAICPLEAHLASLPAVNPPVKISDTEIDNYINDCATQEFPLTESQCQDVIKTDHGGKMCRKYKCDAGVLKGKDCPTPGSSGTGSSNGASSSRQ